jgi:hypothetical protein
MWHTMIPSRRTSSSTACSRHVPVKGLHAVRGYGLYSGRQRVALERRRSRIELR